MFSLFKAQKNLINKENGVPKVKLPPKNNEEISLKYLVKVLLIYAKLDEISLKEKFTTTSPQQKAAQFMKKLMKTFEDLSLSPTKTLRKTSESIEGGREISKINRDMQYLLLNVTTEEFHHFFMEFYSLFDQEKDYLLSKDDFQFIVNYMGNPENMGKEKLNISLKLILSKENALKGAVDKFGRFFAAEGDGVVAPDIFNDLFEELKDENTWIDKGHEREYFINFLKFLPILLSYFLEYMKRRIEIRRENLMVF